MRDPRSARAASYLLPGACVFRALPRAICSMRKKKEGHGAMDETGLEVLVRGGGDEIERKDRDL